MAEATLLAAADLHLGRPIASLPELLQESSRDLGPYGSLERIVELALAERVDAVVLAGDVVDDDGAYFEVFAALQGAVKRLEGIPVLAVAGNHDAGVLPKLAQAIDGLTLLGAGGRWSSHVLQTRLGSVEVIGWSFPSRHCPTSPFESLPPPRGGRRIGLLHGDLDAAESVYAPFSRRHLQDHASDAWLLGHVHSPSHAGLAEAAPMGYLGSACGLDPSECGPRGAWLVRLDGRGVSLEHAPLAPLAWVRAEVQASEVSQDAIEGALHARANELAEACNQAQAVGVRLRLAGEHERWSAIAQAIKAIELGRPWEHRGRRVFIDRVDCQVTAPLPLDRLSVERSAAGRIAAMILELERGEARPLIESVSSEFASLGQDPRLRVPAMGEVELAMPDARATLLAEARAMLSELLAQRERTP